MLAPHLRGQPAGNGGAVLRESSCDRLLADATQVINAPVKLVQGQSRSLSVTGRFVIKGHGSSSVMGG